LPNSESYFVHIQISHLSIGSTSLRSGGYAYNDGTITGNSSFAVSCAYGTVASNGGTITGPGTAGAAAKGLVTVDNGALLSGAGTIKQAAVDQGTLNAVGGTLTLASSIIGTGSVSISSNSVLSVSGKIGVTGLSFLAGGHETAIAGAPTGVTATLSGFAATDTIDLRGFVKATDAFVGHTLTIHSTGGSVAHLNFAASYVTKDFAFATDHHGGTNITFV
jgi:hypothetical protein